MRAAAALFIALALIAAPASAAFEFLGLRNSLVQFVFDQISVEGELEIKAEGVEETREDEGGTRIVGLSVADRDGVWLTAEALSFKWNATRIILGEVEISTLFAEGVKVLRQPAPAAVSVEVAEDSALNEEAEPFAWPRSPIAARIEKLTLSRVEISPGVIAPVGISFDAAGSLVDDGDEQAVNLSMLRTDDIEGRILIDYVQDFGDERSMDIVLRADEAPGGLVAALAELPDDSALRVRVAGGGPFDNFGIDLEARVDGLASVEGAMTLTAVERLAAVADFVVTPGEKLPAEARAALSPDARLSVDIAETETGVVEVNDARIAMRDADVTASGTFNRESGVADLALSLAVRAGLAALVEGVEFQAVSFDGTAKGPLDGLDAVGTLELRDLKTAQADVAEASLAAQIRVAEEISADLSGDADGVRLDRLGPEIVGPVRLTADAAYADGEARLSMLELVARPLTLTADGSAVLGGAGSVDVAYSLQVPSLEPLAGAYDVGAGGALSAAGRLTGTLAAPRAAGRLQVDEVAYEGEVFGDVALDHDVTAGESIFGSGELSATGPRFGEAAAQASFELADENLALDDLAAEAFGARLAGELDIQLDAMLAEGAVNLDAPDLSPLSQLTGEEAQGALRGDVRLSVLDGRQNAELNFTADDVEASGARIDAAAVMADVRDVLGAPEGSGSAELSGIAGFGVEALESVVVTAEAQDVDGLLSVDAKGKAAGFAGFDAALDTASFEVKATDALGALNADTMLSAEGLSAAGAAVSSLTAEVSAVAAMTAEREVAADVVISRIDLGGASIARATASAKALGDDVEATARLSSITAGEATVASAALNAAATELEGGDPAVDARLVVSEADLGAAVLARSTMTAKGPLSSIAIRLDSTGEGARGAPVSIKGAARIDAVKDNEAQGVVSQLEARRGDDEVALRKPLRISSSGGATSLRGLDLSLPGGGLTGDAALYGDGASGELALDLPDLARFAALAKAPVADGSASLDARFDTRLGSAGAKAQFAVRKLVFSDLEEEVGGLTMDAGFDWNGRLAEFDASIVGSFGNPLTAEVAFPLRPTGSIMPSAPANGALRGAIKWAGDISRLWAYVPAPGHVLTGQAKVDMTLSGTIEEPDFGGEISLSDGRYENYEAGTILTELTARSAVASDGAFEVRLDANDGSGNPVEAQVELDDGQVDARLSTNDATLVRRDDVTAALSLDIRAAGPIDGPDISGEIRIDRAEVRLVAASPPGVADLGDVRIKGEPPPEPEQPAGQKVDLNVDIKGPQNIFVRGRGLDSEWSIDLAVRGTAADPRITGKIEKRRGVLDFVGRTFQLDPGEITFTGAPGIDPTLNIQFLRDANDVNGGIAITGTAKKPEVNFVSTPTLPEEEVLPRVLFGQSKQSLSATDALVLGLGVATLLDGSGGATDSVRGAVGLDVLRFEDETDGSGATVTVGSNVADGVFVGAKRSLDGGSSSVIVEIDVFDDFFIDGEIGTGTDASDSIGLNWKRDF